MKTICIKCGGPKKYHIDRCLACGFKPQEDLDICKSRILSEPWDFSRLDNGEIVSVGRSEYELSEISNSIKSGRPYEFPVDELEGMMHVFNEFKNTSGKSIVKDILTWLLPVFCIVGFLVYISYVS